MGIDILGIDIVALPHTNIHVQGFLKAVKMIFLDELF